MPAPEALTPTVFVQKWLQKFAYNDWELITDASFREFTQDIAASFSDVVPTVPAYTAVAGSEFEVGDLVRYTLPGNQEAFFYALQAGPLPAPTALTDSNWKVVPGPIAAAVLYQVISLAAAQNIEGVSVVPGRLYCVDFGPDAQGHDQLVYVHGLDSRFDIVGTLEVNTARQPVHVNVAAGTFEAVVAGSDPNALSKTVTDPQLVAGPVTFTVPPTAGDFTLGGTDAAPNLNSLYKLAKAFEALVDGAPDAFDTLKEIVNQLKSDEQGAAAMLASINQNRTDITALKAELPKLAYLNKANTFTQPQTVGTASDGATVSATGITIAAAGGTADASSFTFSGGSQYAGNHIASYLGDQAGQLNFLRGTPLGSQAVTLPYAQLQGYAGLHVTTGRTVSTYLQSDRLSWLSDKGGVLASLVFNPATGKVDLTNFNLPATGSGTPPDYDAVKASISTNAANIDLLRARIFGQNRGPWTANTAYNQYDFVTYQGTQYYANAAFTSGSAFDATKWTAGTYQQGGPWTTIGLASDYNACLGFFQSTSSLGSGSKYNLFFGPADIQFGLSCLGNEVGANCGSIQLGDSSNYNKIGAHSLAINLGTGAVGNILDANTAVVAASSGLLYCRVRQGSKNIQFGASCLYCEATQGSQWVTFGDNCQDVIVQSTKGTQDAPFTVPANTKHAVFINGVLQTGNGGGSGQLLTATSTAPAAGQQAITQAGATAFFDVGLRASSGQVYALSQGTGYTVSGNTLTILPAVGVQVGQVIEYAYLTGAAPVAGNAGGPTYTAGTGIDITNGVITNTLPRRSAADSGYEETKLYGYQHVTSTATRIGFDRVLAGTHFVNGLFTAPVAGLWIFPATILTQFFGNLPSCYVNVRLYVNGVESGKIGENTLLPGHSTTFVGVSYQFLQAGDQVELRVSSDQEYSASQLEILAFGDGGKWSYFQAILQFAS